MTPHFLSWCLATPWALQPERMQAFAAVLARHYAPRLAGAASQTSELAQAVARVTSAGGMDEDDHGAPLKPQAAPHAATNRAGGRSGAVAVIPVVGTIVQRASQLPLCEGGTSTDAIAQQLRQALADDSVGAVLFDIDSPGGSVYGVAELAAEIRAASKPTFAIANSLAASAAYWIGTAAGELYCSPGGEVGSIGVWMAHEDWSKALEAEGVAVTLISAGKYKTEGNPYGPLAEDARAFLQSRTDDYYSAFTRDVAKGRRVSVDDVRGGMGQGRVLGAAQAREQKMIDGVMTFDQVVRQALRAASGQRAGGRSAQDQRSRQLALEALK